MEKKSQNWDNSFCSDHNNTTPLLVKISKKFRLFIDTLYGKISSTLTSWSFHYWIFFYCLIPSIILITAIILTALPKEIILEYFVQKQGHFLSLSMYLSNFSHMEISHLSANLLLYLISITSIFCFEENKKRLQACSVIFFVIVPIIGAFLTSYIWVIVHCVNGQNFGFSAITLAFSGYALYVFCNWFYVNAVLRFFFKSTEQEIFLSTIRLFAILSG